MSDPFATTVVALGTLVLPDPPSGATLVLPEEPVVGDSPTDESALPLHFVDVGLLGTGGMGEVRRVRDRSLGRSCAYKVIRPELLAKPNVVARFLEEGRSAPNSSIRTSHPSTKAVACRMVVPGFR